MAIAYNTSIVRNGLVLHLDAANRKSYPGSGAVWNDLSVSGKIGTLNNGPTFDSNSKGSVAFDGIDDNISIPLSGNIYAIELWFNPTSPISKSTTSNFIMNFNNGQQSLAFGSCTGFFANEVITILTNSNVNIGKRNAIDSATLTISGWNHMVCNWESLTGYKFYINGIQQTTTDNNGGDGLGEVINAVSPITLGLSTGSGLTGAFSGKVSSCKLYNRALSAAEIQQNFEALRGRYGI